MSKQKDYKTHDYKTVNVEHFTSLEKEINIWAERGWRVVGVISDNLPGWGHAIIFERPVGVSHPDD